MLTASIGHWGACPHFYKWLGTRAPRVRIKTRKWSNCTDHTDALTKTTDCTCKAKKVEGHDKKISRCLAPDMCFPLLNTFQRRWIGLHHHRRRHHRLVHKKYSYSQTTAYNNRSSRLVKRVWRLKTSMTPAGFTISMSRTVAPTSYMARGTCSHFTNSWDRGHKTPHQGFAPGPNWGTSVSQITWPHTITEGPCPRQWVRNHRARGRAPTLTDSWARRTTWSKQETHQSVLPATKALSKMTNCTRRVINLNHFLYKNKSGTLVAVS